MQRVKDFATFLGRSPDMAKSEEVRGFRLHLTSSGAGTPKINATVSALRFFFNVTLDRPYLAKHLSFMHEPRKANQPKPLTQPCPCCGGRMIVIETFQRGASPRYRPSASTAVTRMDTS